MELLNNKQKTRPGPWRYRKIHAINTHINPSYGYIIPKELAYEFKDIKLSISKSGTGLLLIPSGCKQ